MANMVFYESWLETVDAFEKMMGIDFAKEAIYALVYLSIRGEVKTENDLILGWIKGSCLPNVQSAQEKYRKAVEAGKKGGRPKELDYDEIYRLKENGVSVKDIASKMGLTEDSVRSALKRYNKMGQKGQNHDIDKDNDIDKEKEREKEKEIERCGSDEPLRSAVAGFTSSRQTDKPPTNLYVNEDANDNENANGDENGVGLAEAEKSADAGKSDSAELKLKVVQLFKKKYKYAQIQKETGLEFGEISSIINDKEHWSWWENEVKQAREEERSRRSREKQKIEEDNMLKIVREHCEEPIDEKEVLEHYCSESMSEWYYSDLLSFFKINPNKKYTRFRDLSNDIQHDKDEAFKSYPY
jgi:DNA invertase Pin-like site-specific DNA recombinase